MTPPTDGDPASIDSLSDPATLAEEPGVAVRDERRPIPAEKYAALEQRYAQIGGVVLIGVTRPDGAVLLHRTERSDGWCQLGGDVEPGEDWVASARDRTEELVGVAIEVDRPVLYGRARFLPEDTAEDDGGPDHEASGFDAETVIFAASLADPDVAFAADPTIPADLDHPVFGDDEEVGLEYAWFGTVPDDAHPNHVDEIELLLA